MAWAACHRANSLSAVPLPRLTSNKGSLAMSDRATYPPSSAKANSSNKLSSRNSNRDPTACSRAPLVRTTPPVLQVATRARPLLLPRLQGCPLVCPQCNTSPALHTPTFTLASLTRWATQLMAQCRPRMVPMGSSRLLRLLDPRVGISSTAARV